MRLLGAVRLSRDTDESTSPERQRGDIQAYAAAYGHTIVALTEDLDVSGSVAPVDRPGLGPWLARSAEWDAIIVAKLDRLSRSVRDFINFQHDLDELGKAIICLDPAVDFASDTGQLMIGVLMQFAEFERRQIASRTREAHHHIKQGGGFPGGEIPFGYRAVKADGRGWVYEPDPEYSPMVRQMAERALSGESMRQISLWLNETGVPTSRNLMRRRKGRPEDSSSIWRTETVRVILNSPAIAGLHTRNGKPLRDSDGMPVQRCEGIIDKSTWERLKLAITGPAHRAHRVDANPLLRVAFCRCGAALYATTSRQQKRYYRCSKHTECGYRSIPAPLLEGTAADLFLEAVGDTEILERIDIAAEDHTAELADVEAAMADMESRIIVGTMPAASAERILAGLEARRAKLAALPQRPASFEMRPTGQTFRRRWETATVPERRKLMSSAGFRVVAECREDKSVTVVSLLSPELATRASKAAAGLPADPLPGNWPEGLMTEGYQVRVVTYLPPGAKLATQQP